MAELPDKVRAFVAIFPPNEVVEQLELAQIRLKKNIAAGSVRWTKPEQIHLTLQFLGQIERERLNAFDNALEKVASESSSFEIRSETIGCFPNERRPKIIWAGLAGELESLRAVKQKLDGALGELGYTPEERDFHPHLTIGRVAHLKFADAQRLAKEISHYKPAQFGGWKVKSIQFMQSILSSNGAVYRVLKSVSLEKN
jgi:2'-5' RNA ligase